MLNRLDGVSEKPTRAHRVSPACVSVWNASAAPLEAGAPVAFDESEFLAEDALPVRPVTSESTLFAILTSYLDEDAIGAAIVSGAAKVRLSKRPGSGEIYARPLPNSPLVAPATSGYARILRYWQDQDEESKEENWHAIILLSPASASGDDDKGPFDSLLESVTKGNATEWSLTCTDTLNPKRGKAGYVHCGTYREEIPARSWKVTGELVLFLDILYTPDMEKPGTGKYTIGIYAEDKLPQTQGDERRVIVRLAEVIKEDYTFRLLKYRKPGDYSVSGRWVK